MADRSKQLVGNVEPMLYDIACLAADSENKTLSAYMRSLAMKDAIEKGLLTNELIHTLAVG